MLDSEGKCRGKRWKICDLVKSMRSDQVVVGDFSCKFVVRSVSISDRSATNYLYPNLQKNLIVFMSFQKSHGFESHTHLAARARGKGDCLTVGNGTLPLTLLDVESGCTFIEMKTENEKGETLLTRHLITPKQLFFHGTSR